MAQAKKDKRINVFVQLTPSELAILDRVCVLYPYRSRSRALEDGLERLIAKFANSQETQLGLARPPHGAELTRHGYAIDHDLSRRVLSLCRERQLPRDVVIRAAIANLEKELKQDPDAQEGLAGRKADLR